MKKSVSDALLSCPLFKGLNEKELSKITERDAVISVCQKGSVIFSETNYSRSIVVIIKGRASVSKNAGNGKILMSILGKGDIFGMAALFYEEDNFLTEITALENVTILTISKENLLKFFSLYPAVTENYIAILSEKIHFLNKKISTYTKPETISKVASFILQYADENKRFSVLPFSVTNIAQSLNAGRASVYRSFETLEKSGYIKRNGKTIEILDHAALENI